jgi:hypothetical protein
MALMNLKQHLLIRTTRAMADVLQRPEDTMTRAI